MRTRTLATALATLALAAGLAPGLAPAGAADDGRSATLPEAASRALAQAERQLGGDLARPTRDTTLVLRDLLAHRGELDGAERTTADRLLSRPSASRRSCTARICVHWNPGAVSSTDADDNGISDYVDQVRQTVDGVHQTYAAAGYRSPKPDGKRGGDKRTDIYLKDVGDQSLYGYCTSTQRVPADGPYDVWAYCVLDNDYRAEQYPSNTPLENMQVTAAHEYFHAVQFAYDAFEDGWLMEATATWAEDEVFDGVDDSAQYLPYGPLGRPRTPLDKSTRSGHQYGDWIFFRYLTERFSGEKGSMPRLVLDVWKAADGSKRRGPNRYSLPAIAKVLKARGTTMRGQFARFNDANLRSRETYEEGAAIGYPETRPWGTAVLAPDRLRVGGRLTLDHLSAATARSVPEGLSGAWRLKVVVNMAPRKAGSTAVVSVDNLDGTVDTSLVSLDRDGDATVRVPFSSDTVDHVDVTLVNASTRMVKCYRKRTPYACSGKGRDDDARQRLRVVALPPA